jgi:protein-S-isoprenylcysteine O-methyltransferase Ste14
MTRRLHPEGITYADRAAVVRPPDTPGVIAPPPLIYVGGLGIGFGLQALLPATPLSGAVRWPLGVALAVIGGALARAFFRELTRAGTPISPYSAPRKLVTSGPYRVSRNPGYLGMTLAYAGTALLAEALWPLVVLPLVLIVVDRGVIAREERYLQRKFGDEYAVYKRRTRRWL